jgi:hypothetical protein
MVDWRSRYVAGGIRALQDQRRSGRPAEIDEIDVVVATLSQDGRPPVHLGVTHWSARLLAAQLEISFATVARIWRKWNLQPWRRETFKFSTDPELDAKIRDVVGLGLAHLPAATWAGHPVRSFPGRQHTDVTARAALPRWPS